MPRYIRIHPENDKRDRVLQRKVGDACAMMSEDACRIMLNQKPVGNDLKELSFEHNGRTVTVRKQASLFVQGSVNKTTPATRNFWQRIFG